MTAKEDESRAKFVSGMVGLLEPVVKECDLRSEKVLESQAKLLNQLELFSAEMDKLQEVDAVPHLAPYADKLAASRKKLRKVELLVQQTKERVGNISRMHQHLLATEKAQKEKMLGKGGEGGSRPDEAAEQSKGEATPTGVSDSTAAVPEASQQATSEGAEGSNEADAKAAEAESGREG